MQTHHNLPVSGVSAGEIASEGYDLDALLNQHFAGRVVRKDLTKQLKEGANVPVYVLEYLLGMYCASDDDDVVEQGLQNVKRILADNYVRPDEAEKVKSLIRERGSYKIIDKVSVKLNQKKDVYEAQLSNLGIKDALVPSQMVKDNEKLLTGGIWCMITVNYFFEEGQKTSPFSLMTLKPIQMPNMDGYELTRQLRKADFNLPILMVTAKETFEDKQEGFSAGTDDYMVKPIDINEMILRVGALLRRSKMASEHSLTVGNCVLDYDAMSVAVDGGAAETIPQMEFKLLFKLLSSPDKIFTRRQLLDELWGMDKDVDERTVDVHVKRLRERYGSCESFDIVTVRGLGYKAVKKQ